LGFDIPDEHLGLVTYSRRRLVVEVERFSNPRQLDPALARRFLFTKYSHWSYENEVRCFVALEDKDPETNLYFADFSDTLRLSTVIVGAQCTVSRQTLQEALGNLAANVEKFKARLAFKSFRVVLQRDGKLWL
jgi:hypothetical protein